jgi:S1-C subfamily serine protease
MSRSNGGAQSFAAKFFSPRRGQLTSIKVKTMQGSRFCKVIGLSVFVWLASLGCYLCAAEQIELADLIEKVEPGVVRVNVKTADGEGHGSGFVVDADGIVVTNHHVIAGGKEAEVIFANNETAKVLGTFLFDKKRDIAILKIDKKGLPVLKVAEKTPRKGESVVACGAPRGLNFSYSEGIISAVRVGKDMAEFVGEELPGTWLQTTAPISPGNSGGPLINRKGEVVAANTLGSTAFGGQNLNFSISCLDIADVLNKSRKMKLVALSDGAAKSKHEHAKPKRNELAADKIPKEKVESYVKSAKGSYKDAVVEARKKMAAEKKKLTDMKAGRIGTLAMQAEQGGAPYVVIADRGKQFYQYPNEDAKSKVVKKQQEEVRQAEEHFNKIENSQTGMLAYLTKAGPEVELKEIGDVGCVSEIFVTTILDADEFLAHLDDKLPVAVRGMNTGKLASGHSIPGRLMYVCAIDSYGSRGGALNIRVLRELPEEALAEHLTTLGIAGSSGSSSAKPGTTTTAKVAEPEFRTWTDKSGKYKFEAKLVERTGDKVVLKNRDGKVITVVLTALSQADQDHLKALPNVAGK